MTNCEDCANYTYNEESDTWDCCMSLDMDEYEAFLTGRFTACPYYDSGDEYSIVRRQN